MVISAGNQIKSSDVLEITKIQQVYEATGFNSSQSSSGTDEQSHELNTIVASKLVDSNIIVIKMLVSAISRSNNDGAAHIKIQTQDLTNLIYSDSLAYLEMALTNTGVNKGDANPTQQIVWVHTLTNDEKANGVQVKVFSKSVNNSTGLVSVANIQTTQEVKP